jgi:hypothetical protein
VERDEPGRRKNAMTTSRPVHPERPETIRERAVDGRDL